MEDKMGEILDKQYKLRKSHERSLLEEVAKRLDTAIELREQGNKDESNMIMEDMKGWLQTISKELEQQLPDKDVVTSNHLTFPINGEFIASGDKVVLAVIKHDEKDKYLALSYEYSFAKDMFQNEKFREKLWEEFISESAFVCSIYEKNTEEYVGYCSIKNITKEEWELAIELVPNNCRKGYGTEALNLFINAVHKLTGRRFFRVRVEIDNHASQRLMKKLGAYPNGISEFLLHGEEIDRFQAEHKNMITDDIRKVAADFCMEAEDILGYVLEYRFDMQKMSIII